MWLQNLTLNELLAWFAHFLQDSNNLRYGAIALATVLGGRYLTKLTRTVMVKRHLAAKRKQKLMKCQNALKQLESEVAGTLSSSEQEKIVKLDLSQLIAKLRSDEITPLQVLRAYQSKALEVNKQLNCLIEPIIEASEQANAVEQSKEKGPLYGIPISVKDNYGLKGYDSTVGCAKFINSPCAEDAVLVQILKMQGAIPFVKTNIPQTMISWETTNPIFGMTRNPHDNSRGVGGSSGGEGALIAGGGSVLAFGSDIGGSIRIPSNMCGVCGLKPTDLRISNKGMAPMLKGQTCITSAYGPMARDVDSLVTAMKAICVPEMSILDPLVPYKPFNTEVFESKEKLKIGFYLQDGFFHAVPAMERGVLEAKEILERHGHEVVEWDFPNRGLKAILTFGKAVFGDGGSEVMGLMQGDTTDSAMRTLATMLSLPYSLKKLVMFTVSLIYPNMAVVGQSSTELHSVSDWWKFMQSTQQFRQNVLEDWRNKGLDAVISPGFACPALPVNYAAFASGAISYTTLYNALNFPAGSVPVTMVTAKDVKKMKDYPLKDLWHRTVKKGMKGSEGLPVNIQVAALPWQEEMVLRIMKEIENSLKK